MLLKHILFIILSFIFACSESPVQTKNPTPLSVSKKNGIKTKLVSSSPPIDFRSKVEKIDQSKRYIYYYFKMNKDWGIYGDIRDKKDNHEGLNILYPSGLKLLKRDFMAGAPQSATIDGKKLKYYTNFLIIRDQVQAQFTEAEKNSKDFTSHTEDKNTGGRITSTTYNRVLLANREISISYTPIHLEKGQRVAPIEKKNTITFIVPSNVPSTNHTSTKQFVTENRYPQFPWPPPKASGTFELNKKHFANAKNLNEIDNKISNTLQEIGYPQKSYMGIGNDGFALICQMEQTDENGQPLPNAKRWTKEINTTEFDFLDILQSMFFPSKGYFRIIVFIVTDESYAQSTEKPDATAAENWQYEGLNRLPSELGQVKFSSDHYVTALIYEFERFDSGTVTQNIPGNITSKQHLEANGLIKKIK